MRTDDFDYILPEELIAQDPLQIRTDSRLMVVSGNKHEHHKFTELINYLEKGDCLVINDTRVIPARLFGNKKITGGAIEFLLLERKDGDLWEVALKPGRRAQIGARFVFGEELEAEVVDIIDGGNRIVKFYYNGIFEEILDRLGEVPLPHYIKHKLEDRERYQTVYSRENGSAAAPTAGLHFTKEYLQKINEKGIEIVRVTLHVGLGTFRPVKVEDVTKHTMHSEHYSVSKDAADTINRCRQNGGRIICVGTTSVRTIETACDDDGTIREKNGYTNIFIYPGYKFKAVDALITNFHLPKSTLLMLVSALGGKENILSAYSEAVKEKYRFYSFGDAMFIQKQLGE